MPSLESMRDHEAPLTLSGIAVDGVTLRANTPLRFEVSVNPVEGLYTATGPFDIVASAGSRAEMEQEGVDTLVVLWQEYAIGLATGFSEEVLAVRKELLETFTAL